MPASAEC